MGSASLHLVYDSPVGRSMTLAIVDNRELFLEAATIAIRDAFLKASRIGKIDECLGEIEEEEAGRLQRVLPLLIPELEACDFSKEGGDAR